ncbi:MAG: hypothetical protein JWP02_388 [Acidimicrobiales bacterium]|nr:hypothetical protein [Acidimicrobiales bacterium]
MASPFQFERSWELDVTPQRFWDTISRTEEYVQWWPWLRRFEADGMTEGSQWTAVIQSPLPYALQVKLVLDEVVPYERLVASVSGDLEGHAGLSLTPTGGGSAIDVEWQMRPRSRAMQLAAVVARPLLRWSHEWVLARGLEQFRRRALASDERSERDQ